MQFARDHASAILLNSTELGLSLTLMFTCAKWWHALVLASLWIFTVFYFGPTSLN